MNSTLKSESVRFVSVILLLSVALCNVNAGLAQENPVGQPNGPEPSALGWREYRDPRFAFGLAVPDSWTVYPTPLEGEAATATLMNYDSSAATGAELWPAGAVKMDITVHNADARLSLSEWAEQYASGDEQARDEGQPKIETSQDVVIGEATPAVRMRLAGTEGSMVLIAARLSADSIIAFSNYPAEGADLADTQAMLASVVLTADQPVRLPGNAPLPAVTLPPPVAEPDVIHPCTWGDEVADSPIVPLYMPFSAGTNWIPGGDGSYYGDGYHTTANNDYYATDWNLSSGNDLGQPVYPVASGTVVHVHSGSAGYGNYVEIEHTGGQIKTLYAHLQTILVSEGSQVKIQTQIGTVGSTGSSTGPHLHLSFLRKISGAWTSKYGQGARPSPMWTTGGLQKLCDGQSLTAKKTGYATTSWVPLGTLIKSATGGTVYLVTSSTQKRPCPSAESFLSYGYEWGKIVTVPGNVLSRYSSGTNLPFYDGTLVKGSAGTVYVIEFGKRRAFCSASVFEGLGYRWDQIVTIPDSILGTIPTGSDICSTGSHPDGAVAKTASSAAVYLLNNVSGNKVKRLFPSGENFLSWGYRWEQVLTISSTEMASYASGPDRPFRDGTLVKGSGAAVYVVESGKKRLFETTANFEAFGYCWENITTVPDAVLNSIPTGSPMRP